MFVKKNQTWILDSCVIESFVCYISSKFTLVTSVCSLFSSTTSSHFETCTRATNPVDLIFSKLNNSTLNWIADYRAQRSEERTVSFLGEGDDCTTISVEVCRQIGGLAVFIVQPPKKPPFDPNGQLSSLRADNTTTFHFRHNEWRSIGYYLSLTRRF